MVPGRCHQGRAACRQNLLPHLETRIVEGAKGRTLEIAPKRGYEPVGSAPITISVDLPSPRGVSIAGSGGAGDGLQVGRLDASIAGSGDVDLDGLQADQLHAEHRRQR